MTRPEALQLLSIAAQITSQDGETRAYHFVWDCIISLAPEKTINIIRLYIESMEHYAFIFSDQKLVKNLTIQSENFEYIAHVCLLCSMILKEITE
jgi:hypothetical protein